MINDLHRSWRRIVTSIQYRGVPFTLLWCLLYALRLTPTRWYLAYRATQFDRRHAVDTAGTIQAAELGLASRQIELSVEYQPCLPETVAEALSGLRGALREYTFVDLGSGKGMALLAASI